MWAPPLRCFRTIRFDRDALRPPRSGALVRVRDRAPRTTIFEFGRHVMGADHRRRASADDGVHRTRRVRQRRLQSLVLIDAAKRASTGVRRGWHNAHDVPARGDANRKRVQGRSRRNSWFQSRKRRAGALWRRRRRPRSLPPRRLRRRRRGCACGRHLARAAITLALAQAMLHRRLGGARREGDQPLLVEIHARGAYQRAALDREH